MRRICQRSRLMKLTLIEHCPLWQPKNLPIQQVVEVCAAHLAIDEQRDVALVLTDSEHIRTLNRDFRGQDKPTNVLSFPSDEESEWGDILMAHEVIAQEAQQQDKSFEHHFCHLLVHGILHLLGYDHLEDEEAEEMEALEIELLAKLAIANPYETP